MVQREGPEWDLEVSDSGVCAHFNLDAASLRLLRCHHLAEVLLIARKTHPEVLDLRQQYHLGLDCQVKLKFRMALKLDLNVFFLDTRAVWPEVNATSTLALFT